MQTKNKIKPEMSPKKAIAVMSEGVPGAINILVRILSQYNELFIGTITNMDKLGIYGSGIWIGYKDHCKEDLELFMDSVNIGHLGMLAKIEYEQGKEEMSHAKMTERIVKRQQAKDKETIEQEKPAH